MYYNMLLHFLHDSWLLLKSLEKKHYGRIRLPPHAVLRGHAYNKEQDMRKINAAALACFIFLQTGPALAQSLPGHFAAMSGALLPQLRETIKKTGAATPHGVLLQRTDALLREARLTSTADTFFAVDMNPYRLALSAALGMGDISLGDAAAFYQTASQQDLKTALADYFAKLGKPLPEGEDYKKLFDAVKKVQPLPWEGMKRDFGMKINDRQKIDFKWQPENSLVSVIVSDKGTGAGTDKGTGDNFETRIEGEMALAPDPATGKVRASAKPLPDPIRPLGSTELASRDALLERSMTGKWTSENGDVWEFKASEPSSSGFFGGGKKEMSDEDKQAALREDKQARLTELKAKKVYIWKERASGDEVMQEAFKRLDDKHDYVGEGYPQKVKDEIAELERDMAALGKAAKPLPMKEHDPAAMKDMSGGGPVTVTVTEASGYTYTFDEALHKGSVITARRTLRNKKDINDLPQTIIDQLVASWNAPEWIKAEIVQDTRTGDLSLALEVWRLNVTYNGMSMQVGSIHTPWSRQYHMKKDGPQPVSIKYIDDDGDAIEGVLPYGEPIQVEVEFDKAPEHDTRKVRLSWDGDDSGMTWIDVKKSWTGTIYRSDEFTLTPPACGAPAAPSVVTPKKQSCGGGIDAFKF